MTRAIPALAAALSLPLALALPAAPAAAETAVVTAARLLDVRAGRYVDNPVVVITDGRIVSVGQGAPADLPADARRIDLPGLTLLPGLIETHAHFTATPYISGYNYLAYTDAFWPVLAADNARKALEVGFTTVRSLGAEDFIDVGLMQAIEEGYASGPRIIPSGPSFGATGGHCDVNEFPPSMDQRNPFRADSPDEARQRVRELRRYGARVIKICATGGVFSTNTEPGQPQMTLEEMRAVVEEAHRLGLRVAAHAHGAQGIADAIRAGVDTVEHVSLLDDEGLRLAVRNRTWLGFDIYNTDFTQASGTQFGTSEDSLRRDREIAEVQRQSFRRAHEAGARIIYTTDTGVYPHEQGGRQFAVMVAWGMSPLEAIRTATVNAAEAIGWEGQVGVVAPGAWGDLVAVAGDPLADVGLLADIPVVIKGGEVVADRR